MKKIDINYKGHILSIEEVEYFRIIVPVIIGIFEYVGMISMSYAMKEIVVKNQYQPILEWINSSVAEFEDLCTGNIDPKMDEKLKRFKNLLSEFVSFVGNIDFDCDADDYKNQLREIQDFESGIYLVVDEIIQYLRIIRKERNIFAESQSSKETEFYNNDSNFGMEQ